MDELLAGYRDFLSRPMTTTATEIGNLFINNLSPACIFIEKHKAYLFASGLNSTPLQLDLGLRRQHSLR